MMWVLEHCKVCQEPWQQCYHDACLISEWSDKSEPTQIAKFMGPTWDPPGSCQPQMGPMLAPWTLISGYILQLRDLIWFLIRLWHGNTFHTLPALCEGNHNGNVLCNQLWHHPQNINRASQCVKIVFISIIYGFIMSCKKLCVIWSFGAYVIHGLTGLTHLPLDKKHQTTFSNSFSWMKKFVFWFEFHWNVFLRVQMAICEHWFR